MGPGNNNCYVGTGSCDGWCPSSPADPNCTDALIAFNVQTDYISVEYGIAYVITKGRKIPVVSDKLARFISSTKLKYANAKRGDITVAQKIQAEYNAFLKTDDGKIGAERLALIAKETGLKIKVNEGDLQKQR